MDAQEAKARTQAAPAEASKLTQKQAHTRVPAIIISVVIAVIAGLSIWYLVRPVPLLVQGEVDATRLDIAARVDGRVAEIPVVRGQNVTVGASVNVRRSGAAETTPALVTELRPLGAFATWQAERAVGDHDRNTLRLRLDLKDDPTGFELGTVWVEP